MVNGVALRMNFKGQMWENNQLLFTDDITLVADSK